MLTYERLTGNLTRDGARVGKCYAGKGAGLDNPELDNLHDVGPLPAGLYTLRAFSPTEIQVAHEGPIVFELIPDAANDMKGRSGFRLHWDKPSQDFTASEGCIVPLHSQVFQRIHEGDKLTVI